MKLIKILPNVMTLSRLGLTMLLSFYLLNNFGSILVPIIITIIIFLSDFFDGRVARLYGNTSHLGAILDVLADLFYIVAITSILCYFHILPFHFIFIILFKFIEFIVTSSVIKKNINTKPFFFFDLIGRIVALLLYTIPIVTYVTFSLSQRIYLLINNVVIYIIILLAIISSVFRISKCINVFKAVVANR